MTDGGWPDEGKRHSTVRSLCFQWTLHSVSLLLHLLHQTLSRSGVECANREHNSLDREIPLIGVCACVSLYSMCHYIGMVCYEE